MLLFFCLVVLGLVFESCFVICRVIFAILVSFWYPFGVRWGFLATLGLPRAPVKVPCRKSDENVGSFTALWAPLGVPLGTIFNIFNVFSILFLCIFLKRFF